MKNIHFLRCASVVLLVFFALFSVSSGAEDLSKIDLDELISRVEKGEPDAQFKLGLMYYNGQHVKQDNEQAVYWFNKAAEKGHQEAKDMLSRIKDDASKKPAPPIQAEKNDPSPQPELSSQNLPPKESELSDGEQQMKNYEEFVESIIELAQQIRRTTNYFFQDTEFVENEMNGDETVYSRAYKGNGYFFIQNYEDASYSENKSCLVRFELHEGAPVNLKGKIKIGSSVKEIKAFFGDFLMREADESGYFLDSLGSDGYYFNFIIDSPKQCLKSVSFYVEDYNTTTKVSLLYSLYENALMTVKVNGERVNVRSEPSTDGRVLFQVNRSKGDRLIVYKNDYDGWYSIAFIFGYNNGLMNTPAYIKGDFIKKENMITAEADKDRTASLFADNKTYIDTEVRKAQVAAPIEAVRERMYYQNYPQDLDYLPFGKQLEKFFAKGEWSKESVPKLEESFSRLAVFKGIGSWNGRRTWFTD